MAEMLDDVAERERQDLEDLQRHPGWQRLVVKMLEQYSPNAQMARIRQLIDKTPAMDGEIQLASAREVMIAAEAVQAFLHYPINRAKKLGETVAPLPEVPRRA